MPVGPRPERLQAGQDADHEVALTGQCAHSSGDGPDSDAGDLAAEVAPQDAVGPVPFGDRERDLALRHEREERGIQPLRPDREPLRVAARTNVATLTRGTRAGTRARTHRS